MGPDAMILVFWMLSFKPTLFSSFHTYSYIKDFNYLPAFSPDL